MTTLFNRLPDDIRQKIYILYLGFGTHSTNLIKTEINKMKTTNLHLSHNDLTLWRFIIMNRKDVVDMSIFMVLTEKQMKSRVPYSGYFALYELEFAYKSSALCVMNSRQKLAKLNMIKEGLEVHFIDNFTTNFRLL
jgi:hypothetical protein